MADQEIRTHTRWTKKINEGDPYEHVYVTTDGHRHWSVTQNWTFRSGDVAYAWAKGLIERDGWVEYSSDRTGIAPPP